MSETAQRVGPPISSAVSVDPRAVVSSRARLAPGVSIGAYAVVGDDVELGEGCVLHPHAVLNGPSRLGRENILHPFCTIGSDPQDLKFRGEHTELEVGDRNTFREAVTVSRGTSQGGGVTRIGSDNLFMTGTHIAHDCVVGSHTIFANSATLAGHVTVEDYATIGAFSPVHQFCRIGRHAYVGASTVITQDVLPFCRVVTERETRCFGANVIGLERAGFSPKRIAAIKSAYRLLLVAKLNTSQALEQIRKSLNCSVDISELIAFIESSERGVTK